MGEHRRRGVVRVMSFNIRFDTALDEPGGNRWRDRVDSVIETVRREAPDLIGFQEALPTQLKDLVEALPGHRSVGKPRIPGDAGEYVPIFFDRRRFDAEAFGDFWLSTTPELEGSMGWDARDPRHCTWAILKDGDDSFAVFNTHLDRWGSVARTEAARLIVARATLARELPCLVLGDFNALESSEPLAVFGGAGLRDTFRELHPDEPDVQTVHHYTQLSGPGRIDYVLCSRGWQVASATIVRAPAAGRLPSDHYPVMAELHLEPEREDGTGAASPPLPSNP